jgi:hypothetical protein
LVEGGGKGEGALSLFYLVLLGLEVSPLVKGEMFSQQDLE